LFEERILKTVVTLQPQVKHGVLPVKTITDTLNEGKAEHMRVTYQRVGRKLISMGFDRARAGDNAGILYDEDNLRRIAVGHGLYSTVAAFLAPNTPEQPPTREDQPGGPVRAVLIDR
jgi:hypothetical protein